MSSFKQIKLNPVFLIIIALLLFAVGCEGPAGPDGIDGIDGTDITGSECLVCHNDDVLLEKRFELNQHLHATFPNSLSRGTSSGCGRCHSHESFLTYVETGETATLPSVTALTCKSCHTLHSTTEADSFSFDLRATAAVEYLTGNTETFGDGAASNTCIVCHSPRRDYMAYDDTESGTDSVIVTSSHAGPHYGMTGSLIFGVGADDRNGTIALDQGPGTHASEGCVTCHMGENRNHMFTPEVDNCTSCHAGVDDMDINGAETAIHEAVHAIELVLATRGALEVDEDDGSFGIALPDSVWDATNEEWDPAILLSGVEYSAFWNYLMLHSDGGYAFHNPPFVKAVINNMEENLGMTLTTWE